MLHTLVGTEGKSRFDSNERVPSEKCLVGFERSISSARTEKVQH